MVEPYLKNLPLIPAHLHLSLVSGSPAGLFIRPVDVRMKLMTHNFLCSKFLKGVERGYPLLITASKIEQQETAFNEVFMKRMIPKINYPALLQAAQGIGQANDLPLEIPSNWEQDEPLLKKLHHLLVGVEIVEGEMKCPETGRVFPIHEGIPNMLVNADEVD
ncbi:hypothetical protein AB6A40_007022 [Gnathostoma spinigerum]|uniref:Multifunctional methyltransferase subunit TRM112-like protein n=1 Tax=Gnathostoma spinigerum TaxID=75299 RepID=A0ABD6EKA9_9BILA